MCGIECVDLRCVDIRVDLPPRHRGGDTPPDQGGELLKEGRNSSDAEWRCPRQMLLRRTHAAGDVAFCAAGGEIVAAAIDVRDERAALDVGEP